MKENEILLLVRGAKEKDTQCQLLLIEGFRPLILSMIRRYVYDRESLEDYLSEGAVVVIRSVYAYDEDLGVPFPGVSEKGIVLLFCECGQASSESFVPGRCASQWGFNPFGSVGG